MSAALSALVIAISTEFSVLLSARFREERAAGWDAPEALKRTYRSTGAAVLASGVTAIAGFAVLIASDIAMLRDFGLVTVIDLTVSLLGVLAVLPGGADARRARGSYRARPPLPPRRPGVRRPGLLIAVFVGALLTWITFNTIVTESKGSRGLQAGEALPPFAMPLSTSSCRGRCDANVATEPGQGAAGARPACEVRGPDILNSCELVEGGPFVLAFVFAPVARCRDQIPALERVAARHRDVAFRIVAVRADAAQARSLRRQPAGRRRPRRRGRQRVAVVVCPTITYVARGGRVEGSTVGPVADEDIESWVRRL